jgi:hypothetical protein
MELDGAKGLWQCGRGNLTVAVAIVTMAVYGRVAVAVAVEIVWLGALAIIKRTAEVRGHRAGARWRCVAIGGWQWLWLIGDSGCLCGSGSGCGSVHGVVRCLADR